MAFWWWGGRGGAGVYFGKSWPLKVGAVTLLKILLPWKYWCQNHLLMSTSLHWVNRNVKISGLYKICCFGHMALALEGESFTQDF